jgi:hypothetical protein
MDRELIILIGIEGSRRTGFFPLNGRPLVRQKRSMDQSTEHSATDRCDPEQPELLQGPAADKDRLARCELDSS